MKILIMAFPMTMINIRVISDINHIDEIIEETGCWFPDLSLTCKHFIDKYDIDGICLVGEPELFIEGFVTMLKNNYPDMPIQIMESQEQKEVSEDD